MRIAWLLCSIVLLTACARPKADSSKALMLADSSDTRRLWYYDRFDRFEGRRSFELTPLYLLNPRGRDADMTLVLIYPYRDGGRPSDSKDVILDFGTGGSSWRTLRDHSLVLLIDGERLSLNTRHTGGVVRGMRSVTALEDVLTSLTDAQFQKMVNAREVEGRLGYIEFKFSPEQLAHMKRFRELALAHPGSRQREEYTRRPASLK